ncbi:thioredoxin, partial [Dysosmobacter welbionis]
LRGSAAAADPAAAAAAGVPVHRIADGGGLPAGKPAGGHCRGAEKAGDLDPHHGAAGVHHLPLHRADHLRLRRQRHGEGGKGRHLRRGAGGGRHHRRRVGDGAGRGRDA